MSRIVRNPGAAFTTGIESRGVTARRDCRGDLVGRLEKKGVI
jgi:hypothetical protein